MKSLFVTILFALSVPAFAGTVVTKIPPFSGKLVAVTPGLEITSVKIEVENHFCSIGTCAGGPTDHKEVEANVVLAADGRSVTFSSNKRITHRTWQGFKGAFANCSLKITIAARAQNGDYLEGQTWAGVSDQEKNCASEDYMNQKIKESLKSPLKVSSSINQLRVDF